MVSIIIPVYNTARFLPQCLNSVLKQTYTDLEVILVNDASKDKSLSICNRYANKDKRIRIVDKLYNEGVDKARFSGLTLAIGEYVMFIDSDDWLCDKDILRKMVDKAEGTGADYVQMGMQQVMDKHGWIKRTCINSIIGLISQPELFNKFYIAFFGTYILSVNIWGKLYRKSVLDIANLSPSGLAVGEDLLFNMKLFPYLNRIFIMEDCGYSYRFGGMTTKYNPHLFPDLKKLYLLREQLIEQYHYYKASDYNKIEIKNALWSDICQHIYYHVGTDEEIVSNISKELSDPIWDKVMLIEKYPVFFNDPFVKAIKMKDAKKAYLLCQEKVKSKRWNKLAKRIAFSVLTRL